MEQINLHKILLFNKSIKIYYIFINFFHILNLKKLDIYIVLKSMIS